MATATRGIRAALLLGSIVFALAAAEGALRVIYRDGGRRTLGGPGGQQFEHETLDGELRGRRDVGPRRPGVPRLMVVGDSITYGLGVRDWQQTWPELLVRRLDQNGTHHELAVFALPGQDIPQHVNVMREWGERVAPDVFIYQWYVNDIEAVSHRPDLTRAWQRFPWHPGLLSSSYLYFVLNHRLSQLLPPPGRSYVDYLLGDFAPGTMEWAEFERQFHEFATRAQQVSKRRLMVLYPQVPFGDRYPLAALHERMRVIAARHTLEIPPSAWIRAGGTLVAEPAAPWKQVVAVAAATSGVIAETGEYLCPAGSLPLEMVIQRRDNEHGGSSPAVLEIVNAATSDIILETPIEAGEGDSMYTASLALVLPGDGLQRLRFRVRSAGRGAWALASLRMPVDYGFAVLDLAAPLNGMATHASAFDAHPNEAAQRVMAEHVYAALAPAR